MIFGKYINKYYLKYLWVLLIGLVALILVDIYQLKIPEIYSAIIDGLNGVSPVPLNKEYLALLPAQFPYTFPLFFTNTWPQAAAWP